MPRTPKTSAERPSALGRRRRGKQPVDQNPFHDLEEERDYWKARANGAERSLKAKNDQLEAAQFFMSRADPRSEGEVVEVFQDLNNIIYQTAAGIADIVGKPIQPVSVLVDLRHPSMKDPVMMTQYSLQTALTTWCKTMILNWSPDNSIGGVLSHAYSDIQKKTNNGVIARAWRTLTRSSIKSSPISEEDVALLTNSLVMVLHGCCGHALEDLEKLELKKKADSIAKLTSQLDKAITEIHSTDFELLVPKFGDRFCHLTMEDKSGLANGEMGAYEVVAVCAIGLKTVESGRVILKAEVLAISVAMKRQAK